MVDGGVNRWCILATSKTHPRMLPRGSVFRELRGYLPGPLPANKWSRRPTMMNCEFGSSPVCLQPASVPASIESVMLNQLKVTVSYRHPRRRGVPRGVHRRRGGGYHRVGGPGRGRGVGDPPTQESSEREWVGGGGVETLLLVLGTKYTKYPSWGAFVMVPAARFFAVKTHRSPLKRHSTSREGSRSLRFRRLASFG